MRETERQERERRYWDEHAQVEEYAAWKEFPFERWRTKWPITRKAIDYLGPIDGKRLLMPGVGPEVIQFARVGVEVWGFDISERQVAAVQGLVDRLGLTDRIHLAPMAFESLDFPDGFFDIAFGYAILHHIDLDRGGAELARVLRPGGKASFIEPLGMNPVLEFARRHIPYPGKGRTEDERPLTYGDIRTFTRNFAAFDYSEFYLFSMLSTRFIGNKALARYLLSIDAQILPRARWMRRLCQQVWVGVEAPLTSR